MEQEKISALVEENMKTIFAYALSPKRRQGRRIYEIRSRGHYPGHPEKRPQDTG